MTTMCNVLSLIGKYEYEVLVLDLQRMIRKWIFMSTLTAFYTGSTESEVKKQFADSRTVHTTEDLCLILNRVLVFNNLAAIFPAWFGYVAAINVLGTSTLFGTTPQSHYFAVGAIGDKKPTTSVLSCQNCLEKHGIPDDRNQIACFTHLDCITNIDLSDVPPMKYVRCYKEKPSAEGHRLAWEQNALPGGFESTNDMQSLSKRTNGESCALSIG